MEGWELPKSACQHGWEAKKAKALACKTPASPHEQHSSSRPTADDTMQQVSPRHVKVEPSVSIHGPALVSRISGTCHTKIPGLAIAGGHEPKASRSHQKAPPIEIIEDSRATTRHRQDLSHPCAF